SCLRHNPPCNGRRGAATVENWVYGPRNGWYQKLRFVDGRLVQIKGSMD
ncbi:DUF2845 domain-containing protein, partial [Pseudomonas aeruginosa]